MIDGIELSVILPAYNGEKYIRNMIESALSQTYKNFELIIINDGSTDSTYKIIESYKKKDKRIVLINQNNKGICEARNAGLNIAVGKYIAFLDQDDNISSNMFERLIYYINSKEADMVISSKSYVVIKDNGKRMKRTITFADALVTDKDIIRRWMLNRDNSQELVTVWNCLYRSKIIKEHKIKFYSGFKFGGEDNLFNVEYASHCNRVYTSGEVFYNYFRRIGVSTSTLFNEDYLKAMTYFLDRIYEYSVLGSKDRKLMEEYYNVLFSSMISMYYYHVAHKSLKISEKIKLLKDLRKLCKFDIFFSEYELLATSRGKGYNLYLKFIYSLMKRKNYYLLSNSLDIFYIIKNW